MTNLARRRLINMGVTAVSVLVIYLLACHAKNNFMALATYSGVFLYLMMLFLASYNLRKKITMLPLLKSSTWLQMHIYVGVLSIFVFFIHISYRIPNGAYEVALALCYLVSVVTGFFGLYISRRFPVVMTPEMGTTIFEEIPRDIKRLREQAEAVVFASLKETNQSSLADFYVYRLASFFQEPRNFFNHLVGSRQHILKIETATKGVRRYLNEKEIELLEQIEALVHRKDQLDRQYCLQSVLKGWLFVHIPFSYGVLVLGTFHAILAYRF